MSLFNPSFQTSWQTLKHYGYSLRWRLSLATALTILLSLIVATVVINGFIRQVEKEAWHGRQSEAARNAATTVAAVVRRATDSLKLIGEFGLNELHEQPQILDTVRAQNATLLEIVFLDQQGELVASSAENNQPILANLFTVRQSQWFIDVSQGKPYYSDAQVSPNGEPYLLIALPVTSKKTKNAVPEYEALPEYIVAARLRLTVLWEVVEQIHFGERGRAFVTTASGNIIAHTDPNIVLQYTTIEPTHQLAAAFDSYQVDDPKNSINQTGAAESSSEWYGEYTGLDGTLVVAVTAKVPEVGWTVVTELPYTEAFATSRLAMFVLGGGALALGIVISLFAFFGLDRLVFRRLEVLRTGAEQLGRGEFSHRIHLHGRDEMNQVATAFNSMAGELEGLYANLEQKIVERTQALEITNQDLARSNAELAQFAYVASHDLQEPLRMVSSFLQLLRQRYAEKLDADADEFINYAVDGAARMQQLIRDLLLYSRIGTHGQAFKTTNCQIVFAQTLNNLHVAIEESQAQVTHDPLPTIRADTTQMGQLFQNLIGNAIKFRNGRTPEIHLGAQRNEAEAIWLFSVRDNGIGIEEQYRERIFQIFQRLHTREEYPGTGIGLAVCKRIVERHGGRIWLDSQIDRGTTFFFTIPDKS